MWGDDINEFIRLFLFYMLKYVFNFMQTVDYFLIFLKVTHLVSHLVVASRSSQQGHPQSRSLLSIKTHRKVCKLIVSVRSWL